MLGKIGVFVGFWVGDPMKKKRFGCWVEKKVKKKVVWNQIADNFFFEHLLTFHFFFLMCRHVKFQT